jgi:hypothetical protein
VASGRSAVVSCGKRRTAREDGAVAGNEIQVGRMENL